LKRGAMRVKLWKTWDKIDFIRNLHCVFMRALVNSLQAANLRRAHSGNTDKKHPFPDKELPHGSHSAQHGKRRDLPHPPEVRLAVLVLPCKYTYEIDPSFRQSGGLCLK
jgi:hypothetical protein